MRVLVADDNREVRSALRLLLQESNGQAGGGDALPFEVEEATDAGSVLHQLACRPADVVLLDWELPGLASEQLVREIRVTCPNCVLIAMSGRPEARGLSLQMGADAFASKGEPPDGLLALLRSSPIFAGGGVHSDQSTEVTDPPR